VTLPTNIRKDFAERFKILTEHRSENNFVATLKIMINTAKNLIF